MTAAVPNGRSRLLVIAVAVAVLIGSLAAAAGPARGQGEGGTESVGSMTLQVPKPLRKKLRKSGVKLEAKAPAELGARGKVSLPVTSGEAGTVAQMQLAGGLRFAPLEKRKAKAGKKGKGKKARRGKRGKNALLRGLTAVLSTDGGYVAGKLRGDQYTLFELGNLPPNPYSPITGEADFDDATLGFPRRVRSVISQRTKAKRLPRNLGAAALRASLEPVPEEQTSPPVRVRPAGAEDITDATLTWRARESWVDYLHDAPGNLGGAEGRDGAVNGPPETIPPSPEPRVYQWSFPFADGWYDEASSTAQVNMDGLVNYFKLIDPFQIDLDATDPEIELGGPDPRMIATLNGRRNNSDQQNRRAVIIDLDGDAVTPTVVDAGPLGTTYTYERIPGIVPDGTDTWPIAGFYQPGGEWGWITVEFTVGGPV